MRSRTKTRLRHATSLLTRTLLLPAALLLATRLLWSLEAQHRLHKTLAALRAQNIPTTLADFIPPEIPDDQNAVIPLLHAMETVTVSSADLDLIEPPDQNYRADRAVYTPQELARIDQLLTALQPLFDDLDRTASRPNARWDPATQQPLAMWPKVAGRSPLSHSRLFFNTTLLAARRDLAHNDHPAFFRRFHEALGLARTVDASPTLIAHLVAIAIRSNATLALEYFLPTLHLTPADEPAARALITELTDDQVSRDAQFRAYQWELAAAPVTAQYVLRAYKQWFLRPLGDDQTDTLLHRTAAFLPAAASPVYDPALIPPEGPPPSHLLAEITEYSDGNYFSFSRALVLHYRSLADTRAAALLLAAHLFALHNPHPAQSLADLTPYLSPPADPFSLTSAPFHYRPDPAGPTVWSVGEDGVDNGGTLPALPTRKHRRYDQPDLVYGAAWTAFEAALNASSPTPPAP